MFIFLSHCITPIRWVLYHLLYEIQTASCRLEYDLELLLQLLVLLVGLTVIHLPRFSADTVDVSDKIIVITFLRMQDSIDRRFSRIDDRTDRQTAVQICIVWRIDIRAGLTGALAVLI